MASRDVMEFAAERIFAMFRNLTARADAQAARPRATPAESTSSLISLAIARRIRGVRLLSYRLPPIRV